MSAPAATVTLSSSLQAIAKAVSARAKTSPPWVMRKPFVMSSRTRMDTTAWPGSSRSTTMPRAAEARSRCIIGAGGGGDVGRGIRHARLLVEFPAPLLRR